MSAKAEKFAPITRYDASIQKWSKLYVPSIDWRLMKAQFIQESELNPQARSPAGARGLAQIMPRTWAEIQRELKTKGSATDADLCIRFGCYYMNKMLNGWNAEGRTTEDRVKLAQASYNAGYGNILKAQKVAHGAMDYASISGKLRAVTGHHSRETLAYVSNIQAIYAWMLAH
jgi:membrane-bound lytic murein transglycosylase MltF